MPGTPPVNGVGMDRHPGHRPAIEAAARRRPGEEAFVGFAHLGVERTEEDVGPVCVVFAFEAAWIASAEYLRKAP